VGAGLATGWGLGWLFSRAVVYLRCARAQALGMESFLTLGLIALTYGVALALQSYGFLAVFAAGLAMRHAEQAHSPDDVDDRAVLATAAASDSVEDPGLTAAADPRLASAYMAKEVLDFTLDIEKLAEFTVMLLVGSLLSAAAFTPATVGLALALILVVRPVAVYASTWRLPFTPAQRRLAAWFGIRGIGSLYYLAYAVSHGAGADGLTLMSDTVLVAIALSVLLHGSSASPFMRVYRRWSRRARAG
jgi:NhaP-type Na+/H+ or K+/H+ antiporter